MDSAFLFVGKRVQTQHKELKEKPTNRLTRAPSLLHFITIEIRIFDERKSGLGNSKNFPFLPSKCFRLYRYVMKMMFISMR